MSGVSGFFSRGADEAVARLGVRFRDTDPRPLDVGAGIEALIPTKPPIAATEDERLIVSLAEYLADRDLGPEPTDSTYAEAIRAWARGKR